MARQKHSVSLAEALALGQPLTLTQVSEWLQTSTRNIHRLVREGLPVLSLGKHSPRFDIVQLQHWLSVQRPVLVQQAAGLHPKENRLH